VQTVLSGADIYYWFAAGFGNQDQLDISFASSFDLQILGSVVSLCVQLFFVYRIRVLGRLSEKRSRWLCVMICLVTRPPKLQNDLFILPVALRYWRIRGNRSGYYCEPLLLHVTQKISQSQQSVWANQIILGPLLVALDTVKPSNKQGGSAI